MSISDFITVLLAACLAEAFLGLYRDAPYRGDELLKSVGRAFRERVVVLLVPMAMILHERES
jgi:hypothetical protein